MHDRNGNQITQEMIAQILEDSRNGKRAYLRGAYLEGACFEGADLRGAYLEGADLERADLRGAKINWQSHALISHLLFRAANGDIERERWAAWISLRTDLCWNGIIAHIPSDQLEWGLSTLSQYVQDGDDAPEPLQRVAKGI